MTDRRTLFKSLIGVPLAAVFKVPVETIPSPGHPFMDSWITYDIDGDGIEEEVYVVTDGETGKIVFCDYAINHPRPFLITK